MRVANPSTYNCSLATPHEFATMPSQDVVTRADDTPEGGTLITMGAARCADMCSVALTVSILVLAGSVIAAGAQDMKPPRISAVHADWQLAAFDALNTRPQQTGGDEPTERPLRELNAATGMRFPNIAASPVPVLLPFDTTVFLRNRSAIAPEAETKTANGAGNYLFGFNSIPFFYAGPGGYDAVVVARANEMKDLGLSFSQPIYIDVSGSAFLYELPEPTGMTEWSNRGLDEFPAVRRVFLDDAVRYIFMRYGVPYVVSIDCFDGGSRFGTISCREADRVAVRALKSLRLVGGMPEAASTNVRLLTIDRPTSQSSVFTYHSPGDLIAGTGFKDKRGVADYTVFSEMRFPIAQAPAFANSQSFLSWGDCELTGWSSAGTRDGLAAYRCHANGQTLVWDEAAGENYSYPWRDNFCEMRHFQVGQCPGGLGHQGQDIRPAFCRQRAPGNACEPYVHDAVAARDGMVLRAPGRASLYVVANAPGERVRFRYLHMLPKHLDAAGMVSGHFVRQGEIIGKVGNFLGGKTATTYHLHFDLQLPTKYGWVYVNPYMTLVASYERLIEARGREIRHETRAMPNLDPSAGSSSGDVHSGLAATPVGK